MFLPIYLLPDIRPLDLCFMVSGEKREVKSEPETSVKTGFVKLHIHVA